MIHPVVFQISPTANDDKHVDEKPNDSNPNTNVSYARSENSSPKVTTTLSNETPLSSHPASSHEMTSIAKPAIAIDQKGKPINRFQTWWR